MADKGIGIELAILVLQHQPDFRIESSLEIRKERGYKYDPNIDDAETECNLDDFKFDFKIRNDNEDDYKSLLQQFEHILSTI